MDDMKFNPAAPTVRTSPADTVRRVGRLDLVRPRHRLSRRSTTAVGRRRSLLVALIFAIFTTGVSACLVEAAAVQVHAPEGSAHGFLVLRGTKAEILAQGDWWQLPSGDRIEVHLRFRFTDGS